MLFGDRKRARALEAAGDVPALLAMLRDDDELNREHAARSLGRLASPDAIGHLGARAADPDEHELVSAIAAEALGRIRDPQAAPALEAALRHPGTLARQDACEALGRLRGYAGVGALETVCADRDQPKGVRDHAVWSLEQACAVEALDRVHREPGMEPWLRRKAGEARRRLERQGVGEPRPFPSEFVRRWPHVEGDAEDEVKEP